MPITLRPLIEEDLCALFEHQRDGVYNDMAAFTSKDPHDYEAYAAHQARVLADPGVTMRAIVLGGDPEGEVIGSIAMHSWFGAPEVTYGIARKHWGKGYATAALRAFLGIVVERPLLARAASDNVGSLRVLEKCGFVRTRTERGFANARGVEIEETVLTLDG
jgi:RimJ/RimL family protein N-acetyltransferase